MEHTVNQISIFLPVLVIVALTFVAFIRMAMARGAVAKSMDMNFYRAHQGGQEPESAAAAVRHYGNLFEMPVLFYAGSLTAYTLGTVSFWLLVFAWGYVAARLVQSAVHMSYNNPAHRGMAFVLGVIFMLALWINLALAICARL
jgi:hypothetical protein